MSFNFLDLPPEVRSLVYGHLLIQRNYVCPGSRQQKLTVGLLMVNKLVHREASAALYTYNRFDLCALGDPEDVTTFLEKIGKDNAGYVEQVRMDLPDSEVPDFHTEGSELVYLEDEAVQMLNRMQRSCKNLQSLTTSRDSWAKAESRLDLDYNPRITSQVLELINTQLRAISSLKEVIIEVYEGSPNTRVREEMESYDWEIKTKYTKDGKNRNPNRIVRVCDLEEEEFYDQGGYDDEYDIERDSDTDSDL